MTTIFFSHFLNFLSCSNENQRSRTIFGTINCANTRLYPQVFRFMSTLYMKCINNCLYIPSQTSNLVRLQYRRLRKRQNITICVRTKTRAMTRSFSLIIYFILKSFNSSIRSLRFGRKIQESSVRLYFKVRFFFSLFFTLRIVLYNFLYYLLYRLKIFFNSCSFALLTSISCNFTFILYCKLRITVKRITRICLRYLLRLHKRLFKMTISARWVSRLLYRVKLIRRRYSFDSRFTYSRRKIRFVNITSGVKTFYYPTQLMTSYRRRIITQSNMTTRILSRTCIVNTYNFKRSTLRKVR